MLKIIAIIACLAGCGYESKNNELTGQVKKVLSHTPIFCGDFTTVDISLGAMRNGTGSVSKDDMWLTVDNESDKKLLNDAMIDGSIVTVHYDDKRWPSGWCQKTEHIFKVDVLK